MKLKKIIFSPFIYLIPIYLFTRLMNLIKLPIFNDEAIYIDWGYKELNNKGMLFYSLYDGKPPFLMWLFGISQKIFNDPLFSSRMISAVAGLVALIGIYKLTEKYFGKMAAIYSSILYCVIPIFIFYDRQALMESAVLAIGIWSVYFLINFLEKPIFKNCLLLGFVWGLGIFIKQTAFVFILAETSIYFWLTLKIKSRKFSWYFIAALYITVATVSPLFFQKDFWDTFNSNSRFAFSFFELLSLPIMQWITNIVSFINISIWHLTPFIFIVSMLGVTKIKSYNQKIIVYSFLFQILILLFISKNLTVRYSIPVMPVFVILCGVAISFIIEKSAKLGFAVLIASLAIPVTFSCLLIISPIKYFNSLNKLTRFSQLEDYVGGWTSGYGVTEAINYIKESMEKTGGIVGVRVDAGNPESAVFAYFENTKNITPMYFDAKYTDADTLSQECLKLNKPFYFIARDGNTAGMEKFLEIDKIFKKPAGNNYVGIYKLKANCGN